MSPRRLCGAVNATGGFLASCEVRERMLDGGFSLPDRLLDATEVAALLGVPRSWVYQETRAGRMPHVIVGRYRRYRREALEAWIDAHEHGPVQRRRPRPFRGEPSGPEAHGAHLS